MMRITRAAAPTALLATVLALAGCSSSAIDVPEGAQVTIAPAVTPTEAPSETAPEPAPVESAAPVDDALDCATVLPVATIETVLELPTGFVTESDQGTGCAWAMAGNPAALVLLSATGATSDTFAAQQAQGVVEESELGDQAFYRPGDPAVDPAATLVVLLADRQVTVRSYVGDQESLEVLASDAMTALGLDPA